MKNNICREENITFIKMVLKLIPVIFCACPAYVIVVNVVEIFHGASWGFTTYVTQKFFDSVTEIVKRGGDSRKIYFMLIALGAAVIGSHILNGLAIFMGSSLNKKLTGHLGMKVNEKSSKIDPVEYENPSLLDDINKAMEGMRYSVNLFTTILAIFTFYLPYFIFMTVYLYKLKPVLSISLELIFIPIVINQLIRGRVFAKLEDVAAPIRREYEYYEKCICDKEYFKETRLLGAFIFFRDLYITAVDLLAKKIWSAEVKTGLIELGMKLITLLGYMGVLYLLFNALLKGEISIGAFAAIFASIDIMFSMIDEMICENIGGMSRNLGTVKNFIRFLDIPEREGISSVLNENLGSSIKNISFRYPGSQLNLINNISLEIHPRETIAIVGENGTGKSTLVNLMMGLYLPNEGSVKIGGLETDKVCPKSIYKGISAVFQKYQRYKMTLSENISISDIGYQAPNSDQFLKVAVEKADLDVNDEAFPLGYETMLSREFDGVDLSGGQWQRVAISRGFYKSHNMIVLDEPTASIDPIEETKIYNKFASMSKGKTSIIVTHILGSAKIANRIIVMDKGSIIEVGTHEELMNNKSKYAEMFIAQSQWYM